MIGGSHGIGHAIAQRLKEEHQVTIASRSKPETDDIDYIEFDATSDELSDDDLPDEIDGFVFCPGSINLKPFKMLSIDDYEADLQINFLTAVKVLKQVMPKLSDSASVVLFSTVAVNTGMPFHSSVAAAKGAIEGFAKAMAAEYAPKVRFNVIAPSLTDTPMAEKLLNSEKKKEKMAERHPMKRVGTPDDIAEVATFLLSDKSNWITGQIIGVDGGMSTLNIN